MKRINISPGVSVYVSVEMIQLLDHIANHQELKVVLLDSSQKKLLKAMFERNLLVRRRKNNEVSYSIRPGVTW
jgi:hypothetical protein